MRCLAGKQPRNCFHKEYLSSMRLSLEIPVPSCERGNSGASGHDVINLRAWSTVCLPASPWPSWAPLTRLFPAYWQPPTPGRLFLPSLSKNTLWFQDCLFWVQLQVQRMKRRCIRLLFPILQCGVCSTWTLRGSPGAMSPGCPLECPF